MGITFMVYIKEKKGWGWGFGVPTGAMILSIFILAAGSTSSCSPQSSAYINIKNESPYELIELHRKIDRGDKPLDRLQVSLQVLLAVLSYLNQEAQEAMLF